MSAKFGNPELAGLEAWLNLDSNFDDRTRNDSWVNLATGFGSRRDPTSHTRWESKLRLPDQELADLYAFDGLTRKVISLIPRHMFREGYDVTGDGADAAVQRAEFLGIDRSLQDGMMWGRLFGGAVGHVGADDGRPLDTPLVSQDVRAFDFLDVYDRRRAWPFRWYQDPSHPRFGKPETYMLQSLNGGMAVVHETRCIIFRGAHTDDFMRRSLNGWDLSVLDAVIEGIKSFWETHHGGRLMMRDASQGVLIMKGIIEAMTGGDDEVIRQRLAQLDMARGLVQSLVLDKDAGEDFKKVATTFSGVSDLLGCFVNIVAAVTEIPVTLLMGQAPAGLNATGDADLRHFYDLVSSEQTSNLLPILRRLYQLIAISQGNKAARFKFEFHSLWQETPKERADARKTIAETDQIYLANSVVTPEEVATSRFGAKGYSPEMKLRDERPAYVPMPKPPTSPQPATEPAQAPPAPGRTGAP